MGCSGSASLKPEALQSEGRSRLIKAGTKCLSTKNITSCGGLDCSFLPRVELLDTSKKQSSPSQFAAVLPVVQEVVSPKLDEAANPADRLHACKKSVQAFHLKRIQLHESAPQQLTGRHRRSLESSGEVRLEGRDSCNPHLDSSVVCLEDAENPLPAGLEAAGLHQPQNEQASQSAVSQKPRRINTATSFALKAGPPEKRSSTFFASHQDLLRLKNRMASKKDLPQAAGAPRGLPASKANILEHLSGGPLDHCEVRSERLQASRGRQKPVTAARLKKLGRKKSASSRWPRQPTLELLSGGNPSANSSLYIEDRVQSARLPPSAHSSHVRSSEQDLSLNAYLSHLQKLKRQTSSRNVLNLAREDCMRSADEQSDTSARDAPLQPSVKKSIFSQLASPARTATKCDPPEAKHKLSLFKIALEKNAARGEPAFPAQAITGFQTRPPAPRTDNRRQTAQSGHSIQLPSLQPPPGLSPRRPGPSKHRFATDRSEDLENLSSEANRLTEGRHASKQGLSHQQPSNRSDSDDSQISEIEASRPLPELATPEQRRSSNALDYPSSSDSAKQSQSGPPHKPAALARETNPLRPGLPEKPPTPAPISARPRKTFQLLADCRDLAPEI